MDYLITAIVLAIWSFLWYKLGYLQAQINELRKASNKLNKEIQEILEMNRKEISDNYEETIHRS